MHFTHKDYINQISQNQQDVYFFICEKILFLF